MAEAVVSRHEAGILQVSAFPGTASAVSQFVATISAAQNSSVVRPKARSMQSKSRRSGGGCCSRRSACCDELESRFGAAVDLSSSRVRLALRHPQWRAVLAKGCGIDFTGRHFTTRGYTMTALGHYNVLLRVPDGCRRLRHLCRPQPCCSAWRAGFADALLRVRERLRQCRRSWICWIKGWHGCHREPDLQGRYRRRWRQDRFDRHDETEAAETFDATGKHMCPVDRRPRPFS